MGWLRLVVVLSAVVLVACTRVVDGPQPSARLPVAPISAGQVGDLLSADVQGKEGNLFVSVQPGECSGVAREVEPPFLADHDPAATDGGHWAVADREVFVEEMTAVYRADFDPRRALADAAQTIAACRDVAFSVTTMHGRTHEFRLLPEIPSPSPDLLLWSFQAKDWACDSALVAKHNAAVEISTCGPVNGYDVQTLAEAALARIDALANTKA